MVDIAAGGDLGRCYGSFSNVSEGNRFQDECQNLTGDIFMARIHVLVYSNCLVLSIQSVVCLRWST